MFYYVRIWKEGIPISRYTYHTAVTYPDLGYDMRLSHRGLLRMLQEAATIDSQNHGYGLLNQDATDLAWLLSGWRVQRLVPLEWSAPAEVTTWPRAIDGFSSDREFIVRSGEKLVAKATSHWMLVSRHTGHLTRVTDSVRSAYEIFPEAMFDAPLPSRGKPDPSAQVTYTATVGRHDIDTNRHVNNIHYLDYALEALPEDVAEAPPQTLEVVYRRQILLGTPIRCLYSKTPDGRHQVEVRSGEESDPTHHAYLWLY